MPSAPTDRKRLALMLRAQLPYSREQDWLFPVLTECYLPLLEMLARLADEGVPCRLTCAFPETLRAMLDDPALRRRYVGWLEDEIATTEDECRQHENIPPLLVLAQDARDRLVAALKTFTHDWRCDVPQQWRRLVASGHLELAASTATGADLADLGQQPEFLRAQIRLGRERTPAAEGFLSPSGRLSDADSREIAAAGLRWATAECAAASPFVTAENLTVIPTDAALRWLVEDPATGYPAAPVCRSFHSRLPLKYYAGGVEREHPTVIYEFRRAAPVIARQAAEFLDQVGDFTAVCFEMETFGHWWAEGIPFLEAVLRGADGVALVTPSDFLADAPELPTQPVPAGGVATNGSSDIVQTARSVLADASRIASGGTIADGSLAARALSQALRECLLSQCDDWQIMRKADPRGLGRAADREVTTRLERARALVDQAEHGSLSEVFVSECEAAGAVFPHLDWRAMLPRP